MVSWFRLTATMSELARLEGYQERIEAALDQRLPSQETPPELLHDAMRYAVLDGGKRVRPLLTYAAGEALEIDPEQLDGVACAVELIHAYSLVHDDLPAMDDDHLRRGKPTCHIAFGEAMAILAGDALQALAFQAIVDDPALWDEPLAVRAACRSLAQACGSIGMAGGQALDIDATGRRLDFDALRQVHALKTGALIRCALEIPGFVASVGDDQMAALRQFGDKIGLAFQVQDDILDVDGETAQLGKPRGSDQAANKATYPAIIGMTRSRQMVTDLLGSALRELDALPGDSSLLRRLAHFIVERDY